MPFRTSMSCCHPCAAREPGDHDLIFAFDNLRLQSSCQRRDSPRTSPHSLRPRCVPAWVLGGSAISNVRVRVAERASQVRRLRPRRPGARSPRSPATSPTPTARRLRGLRPWLKKNSILMIFPSRTVKLVVRSMRMSIPLARPRPPHAVRATTRSPVAKISLISCFAPASNSWSISGGEAPELPPTANAALPRANETHRDGPPRLRQEVERNASSLA